MKFISVLTIFFNAKKVFRLPKKNKLIILDRCGAIKIRDHILGHSNFTIMPSKNDEINIPIALLAILFIYRYKKYAYEVCFINYVNPRLALTWIDTSYFYCDIFNFISSCKLAFIQNGRAADTRFNEKRVKKYKLDYYFINGECAKVFFKKHIETDFIASGSAIVNNFNIVYHKPVNKIQWISQYKDPQLVNVDFDDWYYKPSAFALKNIISFCRGHNLQLEVLGRGGKTEYEFFSKNFGE